MPDYGAKVADKAIKQVERELRSTYGTAKRELQEKLKDFNDRYKGKDAIKRQQLAKCEITPQQYADWKAGQVFQRKQWESKVREVSKVLINANEQAMRVVNDSRLDVFSENYNFCAFIGEKQIGLSFDVYNTQAVARLIRDDPQILPEWKIDEEKDYEWNAKKVNNIVQQGIIQGEGIPEITKRLCSDLTTQNENKMRTFARTAITGAQNAGRQQQMEDAAGMGIQVEKQWIATLDSRTRHWHRDRDGETVPYNEDFSGGLEYPGDPAGDPADVYNCRCTMITIYPEHAAYHEGGARRAYNEYEDENGEHRKGYMTVNPNVYEGWDEKAYRRWLDIKQNKKEESDIFFGKSIEKTTEKYNQQISEIDSEIQTYNDEYSKLFSESIFKFGTEEYESINHRMDEIGQKTQGLIDKQSDLRNELQQYLLKTGEKEITKRFGKIKMAHSIEDDVRSVNRITGDIRTQNNCGSCSLAYDARRRGIDCGAVLSYGVNNNVVETWWSGLKMRSSSMYNPIDAKHEIEQTAVIWGEGARGIVEVGFTATTGHYFVFEVKDNKCLFLDPQTGSEQAEDYFRSAMPGAIRFGRTDNKELTNAAYFYLGEKADE